MLIYYKRLVLFRYFSPDSDDLANIV